MEKVMKIRSVLLVLLFPLAIGTPALAIDCSKAVTSTEKQICADPLLLQLDSVLGWDYRDHIRQNDKALARQEQKTWLENRDQCDSDVCLAKAYISRIKEISGAENVSVIRKASPQWDFIVHATGCDAALSYPHCEGPGIVDIYEKNVGRLFQRIRMKTFFVELDGKGDVSSNLTELYGENNNGLVVDDFNFDGSDDIALRNGNDGAYGGPSYDIHLYDATGKRFVINDALTELASSNLGLFEVDRKEKTLTTFTKSGCCWHQSAVYRIDGNTPIMVREVTQDARSDETVTIIDRKLVNGTWHVNETKEKFDR